MEVWSGIGANDYFFRLKNGDIIVTDSASHSTIDTNDGVVDGDVTPEQLATYSTSIARFTSTSGQFFDVAPGAGDDAFLITYANGDIIAYSGSSLRTIDEEDGTWDGVIDVDNLEDNDSFDNIVTFKSSSGQAFTVAPGSSSGDYLISLADGTMVVFDGVALATADLEDSGSVKVRDGVIDVDNIVDAYASDNMAQFYSSSGNTFTMTAGVGEDEYLISVSNGDVIWVDSKSLSALDGENANLNGRIDIDVLTDSTSNDYIVTFQSSSGQSFNVEFSGKANSLLITLENGDVIGFDGVGTIDADSEDGVTNGIIDVDNIIDGAGGDGIVLFTSSTGQSFTVAGGTDPDDYVISLENGQVIVIDAKRLMDVDGEDGTNDGIIDVDGLTDDTAGDDIATFYSSTGLKFTVEATNIDDSYIVRLEDGRAILIHNKTLDNLDLENSVKDGMIEVEALFDGDSGDNITTVAVCFGRGTLIRTALGDMSVETLEPGDLVFTLDRGYQPIRWVGSFRLTPSCLKVAPQLKPIRIHAGALGLNAPMHDLLVSPQHRIVVRSAIAERLFGTKEVLVPAKKLLPLPGVEVADDIDHVEYFHILFDQHEVVIANGTLTESLYTGPEALKAVSSEARREIQSLFPEICDPNFAPKAARHIPEKGKFVNELVRRHVKNNKPLVHQFE